MATLRFDRVAFAYRDAAPIFEDTTFTITTGFTGLIGENGAGKTTLLRLLMGEIRPDSGVIHRDPKAARITLCPQSVENETADLHELAADESRLAYRIRARLDLQRRDLDRWPTLSPGERKRWQVGAALAIEPEILLLDEPTNHADLKLRSLLVDALKSFRGLGIVVSHDRALHEAITRDTLRLHSHGARLFPGSYAAARTTWEGERAAAEREHAAAQNQARHADRKLADARRTRAAAEHSLSLRHVDPKDHDARTTTAKVLRQWAEDRFGSQVRRSRSAADRAHAAVGDLEIERELGGSVFAKFEPAPRPTLLALDLATIYAGKRAILHDVHFRLGRHDRVHLKGMNGSGKTTLLHALLAASTHEKDRVLFVEQEISRARSLSLLADVRALAPDARGRVLSLVAALGTDPDRLLASGNPSPGEARKLLLAFGLGTHAWGLVLDEPTNHLDLPTIERLEAALAAYPGAILLVTHDDELAASCTDSAWVIERGRMTFANLDSCDCRSHH
ncbi:MAG: ATP-binding cassette domain-containing protein [Polyangiaceae bacterium]